ncbi:Bromodomain-containing protein [Lipomyces oligophaga]|uniref:Bromodomain-containing protein n=1 Tax=Lipomyces oligophaga TaxID=45792 RepID=UPI0034CD93CD
MDSAADIAAAVQPVQQVQESLPTKDIADLASKDAAPLSPPIPSPPLHHSDPEREISSNMSEKSAHEQPVSSEEPPAKRVKSEHDSEEAPMATPETPAAEMASSADAASAAPVPPSIPGQTLPKHQTKFAHSMLRSLKRLKDAYPFLVPVDPIKLNILDYPTVVKNPMDLATMEKKLTSAEYPNVETFVADFNLIVDNCIRYNGPESKISEMGRSLKASFERQLKQMPPLEVVKTETVSKRKKSDVVVEQSFALTPSGVPIIRRDSVTVETGRPKREIHPPRPKDLPYSESKPRRKKFAAELKFCGNVLKELCSKKYEAFSFPFVQPVDPVALNCPSYFKIIKKPMDLSTVQQKLSTNQYESADEFEEDVRLMFRNCYKFNPEASPVNIMGHRLEAIFDSKWKDKPAPPPPAPARSESPVGDESSEEESEEEEDNSDQINLLEQQLMAMQSQLHMMKKAKKEMSKKKKEKKEAKKKPTVPSGKRKKGRSSFSSVPHVSYDMKKELSEKITALSGQKLNHVVKMIHDSMPHLKSAGQEEIELDVDQLDPVTLVKLYQYVTKNTPGSTVRASAPAPAPAPTKSKKKDQKKQIAQLERQLKTIQQNSDSDDSGSSSDDDSEESSSEEE